jgi:hypothetical protein
MSKTKNKVIDFLEEGGRDLGYSENHLPKLEDFRIVLNHSIHVWEYHGKTHQQYYGGEDE